MLGYCVLAVLTALALLGAVAVALRAAPSGRAELGVVTGLAFAALTGAPVLALGYADLLWPLSVALLSIALSGATFYFAAPGANVREKLAACASAGRRLVALPLAAIDEAVVARSGAAFALLGVVALLGVAVVLTWLIDFGGWDEFIYHVPIVGFAIQNHGFRVVDLPLVETGQGINGYPRLAEAHSLWFALFTGRRLIELPSAIFAVPIMLAVYALVRRYADRFVAMGTAMVFMLVPHTWHQLCTTYNDLETGFFLVAALHYATRPEYRVRDAVVALGALALVVATKITWLVFLPPLVLVAWVRLVKAHRRRAVVVIAGSSAAFAGIASLTLVRNWIHFQDPFCPFGFESQRLGIHWGAGLRAYSSIQNTDPRLIEGYGPPEGGMHDMIRHGYGMAMMWIEGPLGIAGAVAWVGAVVRALVRRAKPPWELGPLAFATAACVATTPTLGQPRYNMHAIAGVLVFGAWALREEPMTRLREAALGAAIALSMIPFAWIGDANFTSVQEEMDALQHPLSFPHRGDTNGFDWLVREREDELGPGDRVFFSDMAFIGGLWNSQFSNVVVWAPYESPAKFVARIDAGDPKWVCVGGGGDARRALERTGRWTLIGRTNRDMDELCYRRRGPK